MKQYSLTILKASVFVFRAAIAQPVCTSFGIMCDRPAVILRLEDADGTVGWGEAWCNFPACGAEHRARLLESVFVPVLLEQTFLSPQQAYDLLARKTAILALQADEPGPMAQCLAAVDIALWDMYARKQSLPLHRALGGTGTGVMPAYASGINPNVVEESIYLCREQGFRAFKCKVGFGNSQDMHAIHKGLSALQASEFLAIDANQAWDLAAALRMVEQLADMPLEWLEEPLRCDSHISQWQILAKYSPVPLAAGENIRCHTSFREATHSRALHIIQPDLCKWGGLTQCLAVARTVLQAGLRYCPHYLGGGIGLVASAHLLAAVGGDGLLEIDVNTNPLREGLAQPYPVLREGLFSLSHEAGLGVSPDIRALESCLVSQWHSYA